MNIDVVSRGRAGAPFDISGADAFRLVPDDPVLGSRGGTESSIPVFMHVICLIGLPSAARASDGSVHSVRMALPSSLASEAN